MHFHLFSALNSAKFEVGKILKLAKSDANQILIDLRKAVFPAYHIELHLTFTFYVVLNFMSTKLIKNISNINNAHI